MPRRAPGWGRVALSCLPYLWAQPSCERRSMSAREGGLRGPGPVGGQPVVAAGRASLGPGIDVLPAGLQPADTLQPRQDGVHRAAAQLGPLADLHAVELALRGVWLATN